MDISKISGDQQGVHLTCRKVVKDDNENVILINFLSAFISVKINLFYYIFVL